MRLTGRSVSLIALTSLIAANALPTGVMAAEHVVRIVTDYEAPSMTFAPKVLKIEPGDRVTWVNEIDEEHNVVTFPDGFPRDAEAFQSPLMKRAGECFSYRFDVPGTYEYHCMPHLPMNMQGIITVGQPSNADASHQPSTTEIDAYRDLMLEWFDEDDITMLERQGRMRDAGLDQGTNR
ncbi:MAG: plastocyanin/azurin family copper-binding protein [Geminicoccaceae bacterium]